MLYGNNKLSVVIKQVDNSLRYIKRRYLYYEVSPSCYIFKSYNRASVYKAGTPIQDAYIYFTVTLVVNVFFAPSFICIVTVIFAVPPLFPVTFP